MSVIKTLAMVLRPILDFPYVRRVRRNHAYEHATIHMLSRYNATLSGRASGNGFVVVGNVTTEQVEQAAEEALARLRNGQSNLALHPNCGTNLVTAGMLMTLVGALGFTGTNRRKAWERFPFVMILMMVAFFYSTPLGMTVQKHITTEGDPGNLEYIGVKRNEIDLPFRNDKMIVHKVVTRKG